MMMTVLSTLLNVVVVAACIIAAARLLPRLCLGNGGASRPSFGTGAFVAVLVATAVAAVVSHGVGGLVAEALVALLIPRGAQAVFASRDAGEQLADVGAFCAFALLVAPLAAVAIARAFTLRRGVIARVAAAALVGEAALACAALALMRPFWAMMMPPPVEGAVPAVDPLFDVVAAVAHTVDTIVVFAIVGVIAGVAFTVVAVGPALRARDASERRALIVAACVSAPAALVLGGLATPSPDIVSQVLAAMMIGAAWLVAVGLGRGAGRFARRP